ncbi:hypothetical protein A6A29_25525 [Streptomyces sp. TSRI0281]|nr:hypothetical protein A6A29_25525 [Streptomyces sp. TSRI0281]
MTAYFAGEPLVTRASRTPRTVAATDQPRRFSSGRVQSAPTAAPSRAQQRTASSPASAADGRGMSVVRSPRGQVEIDSAQHPRSAEAVTASDAPQVQTAPHVPVGLSWPSSRA